MSEWLGYTLIATAVYGLWGLFPKLARAYVDPRSAMIYQSLGTVLGTLVILASARFRVPVEPRGIGYSLLAGIAGVIGTQFLLMALAKGNASLVVPVTALYPIGVVILAMIFLKEPLTWKQTLGIVISLVGVAFIAAE